MHIAFREACIRLTAAGAPVLRCYLLINEGFCQQTSSVNVEWLPNVNLVVLRKLLPIGKACAGPRVGWCAYEKARY